MALFQRYICATMVCLWRGESSRNSGISRQLLAVSSRSVGCGWCPSSVGPRSKLKSEADPGTEVRRGAGAGAGWPIRIDIICTILLGPRMRGNSASDFDWDDANVKHLARHKIKRAELEEVFANDPAILDHQVLDEEERWSAVGSTNSLRVLVIVFTFRGERVRPITAWQADRRTARQYFHERGS